MAMVSVVLIGSSFLLAFPPVAGRPGGRLPPGCVSGHHATDVIEAAGGMGGDAVLHRRPVRTWAAGPGGGCPVPARLASGPANQPIGVVAAVELTSCTVPGRRGCGAGIGGW